MPTKEHRRQARVLVEALELRVHAGPPVCQTEISSARNWLRQLEFPAASDYFNRLEQVQNRVALRPALPSVRKRNYGGAAGGVWMQLQSVYDHVIISTCHQGEFNTQRGRVKLSHRFNQAGRIDFVELKLLRSLHPHLDGALRKLITVKDRQTSENAWHTAEAFPLRVLPQELVFLHANFFRFRREDTFAWLINLGHWTAENLLKDLNAGRINGCSFEPNRNPNQLALKEVASDQVAIGIVEQAARLECTLELDDSETAIVRYVRK